MRAAIYTRYSSENQREASLEDQERVCRQKADGLGYSVVRVFKDAALSGQLNEEQRPGFAAMQDAAKRREFDVLIVDDASRLSRDRADADRVFQRLEHWRIGLITCAGGVDTVANPDGSDLVFGINAVINRQFL